MHLFFERASGLTETIIAAAIEVDRDKWPGLIESSNSWAPTTTASAPTGRELPTAVWTGTEMIVWGGYSYDGVDHYWNTGGRYNPGMDSWLASSTTNAPGGRESHRAVWTGSEMIVWGGYLYDGANHELNTGGKYNPGTNNWIATSTTNVPAGRDTHGAVWTGSEMIVWGDISLTVTTTI